MPKIICKCGVTLRYGDIPNPIEWLMIADEDFDKFSGSVDAEELYVIFTHMLRCPNCSRLWVFWNGFSEDPQVFTPDAADNVS